MINEQEILKLGSTCSQSNHCCRYGSGFVLDNDMDKLSAFLHTDRETLKQHCLEPVEAFGKDLLRTKLIRTSENPYGTCLFFHAEKGCTVHEAKPLHCRIGNCSEQGQTLSQWYFDHYVIDRFNSESLLSKHQRK